MEKTESSNSSFPFVVNKDIDMLFPKEKRTTFQKSFAYIKRQLEMKSTRKTFIDSILKKCKGRFFKAIHDCLRKCIKKEKEVKKIPQNFITDISIETNKFILDKSLYELYQYFNIIPEKINNSNDDGICLKGKEKLYKYLFSRKISELYLLYTQSKRFKKEVFSIKEKSGLKMSILYQFVSLNVVNYYYYTRPHITKFTNEISLEKAFKVNNNKLFHVKRYKF